MKVVKGQWLVTLGRYMQGIEPMLVNCELVSAEVEQLLAHLDVAIERRVVYSTKTLFCRLLVDPFFHYFWLVLDLGSVFAHLDNFSKENYLIFNCCLMEK